jgi:geranylgeranyl pyrophosphate synthase
MHCAQRCSEEEQAFLRSLLNRSGPYSGAEVSRLKDLLAQKGSLEYARQAVSRHTEGAKAVLHSLPESTTITRLFEVSDYLAERYY